MNSTSTTTAPLSAARHPAGWLLAAMLCASLANTLWPAVPVVLAAALAWLAAVLLWPRLGRQSRVQVVAMTLLGVAGLTWGALNGAEVSVGRALSQNQAIVSMLASVGLLRLLNRPLGEREPELPRGLGTYVRSMLGVHLFAAVINISALVIMADRLARGTRLHPEQARLLSRSFTMAAFYSPFIAGVGMALAYTPGSSLAALMLLGVPLALCGFAVLYLLARLGAVAGIEDFRGYPVHLESLWLPAALGLAVLLAHQLRPDVSVLALVTLLTPAIVIVVLLARSGPAATRAALVEFASMRLPDMAGELALFLSAGVFASGLVAVFAAGGAWLPFAQFDALAASLLLAATLAVSALGVHPVIVVSGAASLLAPLEPEPTLLALVFAVGWGLGCAINPLSGTNLTLQGRYGIDNWALGRANVGFALILGAAAVGLFHLYAALAM